MANFTELESHSIKRISETILKIKNPMTISITCTISCGLDFPVLGV